jgi:hypothetical protein
MKKTSLAVLVSLAALAGVAHAEDTEIRTITDPGQISAIEQHAQELRDQPEAAPVREEEHHAPARRVVHHKAVVKKMEEHKDDKAK